MAHEQRSWFNVGMTAILGYEKGKDYVEVECGCTNKKYGDFVGKLRIYTSGEFSVTCHCFEGCKKGKLLFIFSLWWSSSYF